MDLVLLLADSNWPVAAVADSCCTVVPDYMRVLDCKRAVQVRVQVVDDIVAVLAVGNLVVDQNRDRCSGDHKNRHHHHSHCCGKRAELVQPVVDIVVAGIVVVDIVVVGHSQIGERAEAELVELQEGDHQTLGSCQVDKNILHKLTYFI